ncbi:amidohydrolase [Liquorilactobacillus satsumensis]|uniref:amidohydrolase n=1 Tax=Liquorilactobacillus satsumensis TaxID=259059 RepID=UPI0039E8666C
MTVIEEINNLIDHKQEHYRKLSDKIWELAEPSYKEHESCKILQSELKRSKFTIIDNISNLSTAFIAEFGNEKPIIGILGEYDALKGLSQKANVATQISDSYTYNGHGCGHNLLGVGSLAAAIAIKECLNKYNLKGTIRFYGCPAEENGHGKVSMINAGCFKDLDVALSWHPGTQNRVLHLSSTASELISFKFYGKSSHASDSPERGRSALDAVELLDVGLNYLREHIGSRARVHYSITDSGGDTPNVVQEHATELCMIRDESVQSMQQIVERVKKIALGAAFMTGTRAYYQLQGGTYNLIPNTVLDAKMFDNLVAFGANKCNEADQKFAKKIFDTFDRFEQKHIISSLSNLNQQYVATHPIAEWITPFSRQDGFMQPSTDVGDVSWNVPTSRCNTATWALGTAYHSWQAVAQGKTSYAVNSMFLAAKVLAATAIDLFENSNVVNQAKEEWKLRTSKNLYHSIPVEYSEYKQLREMI